MPATGGPWDIGSRARPSCLVFGFRSDPRSPTRAGGRPLRPAGAHRILVKLDQRTALKLLSAGCSPLRGLAGKTYARAICSCCVSDIDHSELSRYVQYLQRQIMTPGTEEWFQHERFKNAALARPELLESVPAESGKEAREAFLQFLEGFEPSGEYDAAPAAAIFQPLMDELLRAAERVKMLPKRPITLAASTAIEVSPFTRSSEGVHIILVGPGTFAFCNYWAKIFSALPFGTPARDSGGSVPLCVEAVRDAARLTLYYAITGTVLGFGVLEAHPQTPLHRHEYLRAMELFVLGHEFGHCVMEDADERYRGQLTPEVLHELEIWCDRIGTSLTRFACEDDSWSGFCGAGAILMLFAHDLCATARKTRSAEREPESHSHPPFEARLSAIRTQVLTTTPDDQREGVTSYVDDLIAICSGLRETVGGIVQAALATG